MKQRNEKIYIYIYIYIYILKYNDIKAILCLSSTNQRHRLLRFSSTSERYEGALCNGDHLGPLVIKYSTS